MTSVLYTRLWKHLLHSASLSFLVGLSHKSDRKNVCIVILTSRKTRKLELTVQYSITGKTLWFANLLLWVCAWKLISPEFASSQSPLRHLIWQKLLAFKMLILQICYFPLDDCFFFLLKTVIQYRYFSDTLDNDTIHAWYNFVSHLIIIGTLSGLEMC